MRDEYLSGNREIGKADYEHGSAAPEDRVPAGQLVVFGDNRNDSACWGYLPEAAVEGQATLLFSPRLRRL